MKVKKHFHKSACMLLILSLLISLTVPAFAADESGFYAKLEKFKSTRYANNSTYVDNSAYGGYECFGFANELAVYIFGSYPTNSMSATSVNSNWTRVYGGAAVDNLAIGDIVRYHYHSIFITGISGDTIYYCQANVPYKTNRVTYDNTVSRSSLKALVSDKLTSPNTDKTGWVAHYKSGISPVTVTCECNTSYAGTYKCTTSSQPLTIRSGHGTSYSAIGSIPSGATCKVTKADGSWAHVEYDGKSGYASMQYLQLVKPDVLPDLTVDNRYPTPIKMYPISTNQKAANAYMSYSDMLKAPATDQYYIYNTDLVTINAVYTNQAVYLSCPWSGGTTKNVYSYGPQFFSGMNSAPKNMTAEKKITTYIRPGGSAFGWIDAGDKIVVLGTSGIYSQVIYPHTDGTYRCMWCLTSDLIHTHKPGAAATCTTPQVCTVCDEIIAAAKGHNFNQKKISDNYLKTPATCNSAAVYYYSCTCGEAGTSTFTYGSALGHSLGTWKNYDATYHSRSCTRSGCTYIEKSAHTWNSGAVTKAATCTATGVKTYTCTVCGATKTETIPIIPHTHNQKNTSSTYLKSAATCTSASVYYYSCSCGAKGTSTFSYGDALGHKYDNACDTTCNVCGYTRTTTHSYGSWTTTKAATCIAAGSEKRVCSICGNTETRTTAALGHKYDNACDTTCNVCGYTRTTTHSYGSWTTTKAATCTVAGSEKRVCSICGNTETRTTAALGHDYIANIVAPTCTEQGYTTHTCSRCSDSYKDTYVAAKGHSWNNGVVTKAATTSSTGIKTYTCTVCGATKTETIPKLPQASDTLNVGIDTVSVQSGKEFTVKFDYEGVDGLRSFGIWYTFDKDVFEFVGGKCLSPDYGMFDASEIDGLIAAFDTPAVAGEVAEATFRVKDGVEAGDYTIAYEFYAEDSARNKHEYAADGKVTVTTYIRGDVNDDSTVNSADALYLLRYTMRASKYPINQSGDMNGDNTVNSADALYLLRYTMRPSKYPLF